MKRHPKERLTILELMSILITPVLHRNFGKGNPLMKIPAKKINLDWSSKSSNIIIFMYTNHSMEKVGSNTTQTRE